MTAPCERERTRGSTSHGARRLRETLRAFVCPSVKRSSMCVCMYTFSPLHVLRPNDKSTVDVSAANSRKEPPLFFLSALPSGKLCPSCIFPSSFSFFHFYSAIQKQPPLEALHYRFISRPILLVVSQGPLISNSTYIQHVIPFCRRRLYVLAH